MGSKQYFQWVYFCNLPSIGRCSKKVILHSDNWDELFRMRLLSLCSLTYTSSILSGISIIGRNYNQCKDKNSSRTSALIHTFPNVFKCCYSFNSANLFSVSSRLRSHSTSPSSSLRQEHGRQIHLAFLSPGTSHRSIKRWICSPNSTLLYLRPNSLPSRCGLKVLGFI